MKIRKKGAIMPRANSDIEALDAVTQSLYASICFKPGERPPLEQLRGLFVPGGRLIDNNGPEPAYMTVDEFIAAYQGRLDAGKIASFFEGERSSRTDLFGRIAHRFSTYEARFSLAEEKPFSIGINSIQYIRIGDAWRVTCMVWNDQTDEVRIPEKYL
jgi:hypothetical protein